MSDADSLERARSSLRANIPQPVKDIGVREVHEDDNVSNLHTKDAVVPNLTPGDTEFSKRILIELEKKKSIRKELSETTKALEDKKDAA